MDTKKYKVPAATLLNGDTGKETAENSHSCREREVNNN